MRRHAGSDPREERAQQRTTCTANDHDHNHWRWSGAGEMDMQTGKRGKMTTQGWRRFHATAARMSTFTWLLLAYAMFVHVVSAVSVTFSNCLSTDYQQNTPTLLQWVPAHVDAKFDNVNSSHRLTVTMWGNVTGALTNVNLPPPDSLDWTNPRKLDGKILDNPNPDGKNPKLTTLHSKIDVVTYEPFAQDTEFCNSSLTNGSCPLAPVFNPAAFQDYWLLPSVSMSKAFYSSYAFTSFSPTFLIIYGDPRNTTIGCVSTTVTPDLGGLTWMLKFLPFLVLLSVGGATVFAGIFSPWGTTDIFLWTSNSGRHNDLLRLVTPGFGDCLQYIQFIALTGGLTLNYPGFYQPIVSQASWSALMFNESFVSREPGWPILTDGIYYTNGAFGLEDLAQLVGMGNVEDIWAGMMVWLLVIIAAATLVTQMGFGVQRLMQIMQGSRGSDLRNKNFPFTVGNVVRIVFNYFLLPIVALSTFQLVVASQSPSFVVALAAITLVVVLVFAGWLLFLITSSRPRSFLFDDLPTLLLYGPLYNTYSDDAAAFALIPVLLTFVRGIAIGAVESNGIAQIIILAICEVVQIITLHTFKPFSSPTSMNAYHTLFSVLRFATVILMTAFIPQLGITDGPKGWIGYTILLIHGAVLLLGFFLNAFQKSVEVVARMLGAGGDDERGLSLVGGVAKIFGHRQLKRRMSRRGRASRLSQVSASSMLGADDPRRSTYAAAASRVRSGSAGSNGVLLSHKAQRSSSALDRRSLDITSPSRQFDRTDSFGMGTPGQASTYSFLPSPGTTQDRSKPPLTKNNHTIDAAAGDIFYRPPRRRRETMDELLTPGSQTRGSWLGGDITPQQRPRSQIVLGSTADPEHLDAGDVADPNLAQAPYTDAALAFPTRADYATREVDYYYGVQRGERLNSDKLGKRMGTGPADPTGPIASATGWVRNAFGGKRKEKGKGFEVVRSSRMPPAMKAAAGDYEDEDPPEGTPVALGVLRKGPIESDDDDNLPRTRLSRGVEPRRDLTFGDKDTQMATKASSRAGSVPPLLPDISSGGDLGLTPQVYAAGRAHSSAIESETEDELAPPNVPRKSSRRKSDLYSNVDLRSNSQSPARAAQRTSFMGHVRQTSSNVSARLPLQPFQDTQRAVQGEESSNAPKQKRDRPSIYGHVSQGSVTRLPSDARGKQTGSAAEYIND